MRIRSPFMSFLVAMALAMLPLASVAGAMGPGERGVASQTIMESTVGVVAEGAVMASMDASTPMDDCCLPHGAAGDPCKSSACCAVHCAGVAPILQSGFVALPDSLVLTPVVRDQVVASTVGAPPFRPPRV